MVLEPRVLLDASLVDTTSIEADPEQPTDLRFDVPGTRVLDPRVLDPRLSDPQAPQRMITPDLPTIRNWLDTANTHNARLSIVVKLWDAQPEDRISLAETYSSSSVLRDTWDDARGELRLDPRAGAASPAVAEAFLEALQAVQLEASGAEDASTREVWVFPTLSGASEVAYRVERSSGMVRHYVLDASLESYADAHKTAEQQRFFGVDGYLGHFSSDAEKSVYGSMAQGRPLWLGLSDKDNAGVWKVSSGPKQGQVFWRETGAGVGIYGSGARSSGLPGSGSPGSGWGDADWEKFWGTNDFPHRASSGSGFPVALLDGDDAEVSLGSGFPVALLSGDDAEVSSSESSQGARIVHHDLLLSSGGFFAREVRVPDTSSTEGGRSDADTADTAEVAPEKEVFVRKTRASLSRQTRQSPSLLDPPVLDVTGLARVKVGAEQRLILTEARMSVTDVDTRDPTDDTKVYASMITFRVRNVVGGTLQKRTSASAGWDPMTKVVSQDYYAFTLADLQSSLVAFFPNAGVPTLNFHIQAVDDDGNLSDSDHNDDQNDADPVNVSVRVVALKEIEAGQQGALNDDEGLTPDPVTLQTWFDADGALRIFVELQGGKSGIVVLEEGAVDESLSLSGSVSNIAATWDGQILSLRGNASATVADFEAALGALQLQTVRFKEDGYRTISVRPDVSTDVPKKVFYVRQVKVGASPKEPLLSVRGFERISTTAKRYLVLDESHMLVDDADTRDPADNTKVDASRITFRVSDVVGGTLQKRISASADWVEMTKAVVNGLSQDYYAFTLADLQGGLVALSPDVDASTLIFKVQAADDGDPGVSNSPPHLSDSDPDTDGMQPTSVSIRVVALKEIEAGQEGALNDDRGLTPDADTLQVWLDADSTLKIFVEFQGGKSGIVVPEEGAVEEALSLSAGVSSITAAWDGHTLSLQSSGSATVDDFVAALGALQLQTVRFKDDSYRTISVRPDLSGDVPKKDFYVREVKVGASPKEPLLSVRGFERISTTAERYLVLGESHVLVDDVDTVLPDGDVDASKIVFRITELVGGRLHRRASALGPWVEMTKAVVNGASEDYYAFTLADLQGGLVSFSPDADVSTLIFKVQAADDENNFSDSDPDTDGMQPAPVSIRVVALKEIEAGQQGALNDDGGLTPDDDTLQAWLDADDSLQIFVELQGRKSGIVVPEEGEVDEALSLSTGVSSITAVWDGRTLSLQSSGSATVDDFVAALGALQLQTVRFKDDSYRTISVRPDLSGDVPKKDFYVREVKVEASPREPLFERAWFCEDIDHCGAESGSERESHVGGRCGHRAFGWKCRCVRDHVSSNGTCGW